MRIHDLATLDWTLTGYTPETWRGLAGTALGAPSVSELPPLPARVPASVQQILREHGVIPDWNHGLDSRAAEWVENRNWVFSTTLPRVWLEWFSLFDTKRCKHGQEEAVALGHGFTCDDVSQAFPIGEATRRHLTPFATLRFEKTRCWWVVLFAVGIKT